MFGWGKKKPAQQQPKKGSSSSAAAAGGRDADMLRSLGLDPSLLSDPAVNFDNDDEYEAELARALEEEERLNGKPAPQKAPAKKAAPAPAPASSGRPAPETTSLMVDPNVDDINVTEDDLANEDLLKELNDIVDDDDGEDKSLEEKIKELEAQIKEFTTKILETKKSGNTLGAVSMMKDLKEMKAQLATMQQELADQKASQKVDQRSSEPVAPVHEITQHPVVPFTLATVPQNNQPFQLAPIHNSNDFSLVPPPVANFDPNEFSLVPPPVANFDPNEFSLIGIDQPAPVSTSVQAPAKDDDFALLSAGMDFGSNLPTPSPVPSTKAISDDKTLKLNDDQRSAPTGKERPQTKNDHKNDDDDDDDDFGALSSDMDFGFAFPATPSTPVQPPTPQKTPQKEIDMLSFDSPAVVQPTPATIPAPSPASFFDDPSVSTSLSRAFPDPFFDPQAQPPKQPDPAEATQKEIERLTALLNECHKQALIEKGKNNIVEAKRLLTEAIGYKTSIKTLQESIPGFVATPIVPQPPVQQPIPTPTPTPVPAPAPAPAPAWTPEMIAAEQVRQQQFTLLEAKMDAQINNWIDKARENKAAGEAKIAVQYLHELKQMKSDLIQIQTAKRYPGVSLPTFRIEKRTRSKERFFQDIGENDMILSIIEAKNISPPSGFSLVDCYVTGGYPFPDADKPGLIKTPVVKNTLNPKWSLSVKLPIERKKKNFLRLIERKKLVFELFHSRFMFGDISLGKVELSLMDLTNKSQIDAEIPIMASKRTETGGKLRLRVRLRYPLIERDIESFEEQILVIVEHMPMNSFLTPSPLLQPVMPVLSPAPTATVTKAAIQIPVAAAPVAESSRPKSTGPSQSSSSTSSSSSSSAQPSAVRSPTTQTPLNPSPVVQSKPASTPSSSSSSSAFASASSSAAVAPSSSSSSAPPADEEEFDPNPVSNMVSNSVLEWALEETNKKIKMTPRTNTDELEDLEMRKQQIQIKIDILMIQIQTEKLTIDQYTEIVQKKIVDEKKLAFHYKQQGNLDAAKLALLRMKLMEKELTDE